jgi:hypothetical protein
LLVNNISHEAHHHSGNNIPNQGCIKEEGAHGVKFKTAELKFHVDLERVEPTVFLQFAYSQLESLHVRLIEMVMNLVICT